MCTLVGAVGAAVVFSAQQPYEARAIISISTASSGSPDRFMATKLQSLQSDQVRRAVADAIRLPVTAIAAEVSLTQQPASDLLVVQTRDPVASRADAITRAYVTAFLDHERETAASQTGPALDRLNQQIASLQRQLDSVNKVISRATQEYISRVGTQAAIPPAEVVAPDAAATRAALADQYTRLLDAKSTLEFTSNSPPQLVSFGSAVRVTAKPRTVLLAAGLILGASVGTLIALLRAQLSSRLVDGAQVEELLGTAVIGTIDLRPRRRRLASWARLRRRNEDVLGAVLARARGAAQSSPIRVAVASVEHDEAVAAIVEDLVVLARAGGVAASVERRFEVEADTMLARDRVRRPADVVAAKPDSTRAARGVADRTRDDGRFAVVNAGRLFLRPRSVDDCLVADAVVIVIDVDTDRVAPLIQLAQVLEPRRSVMLPVTVRRTRHARRRGAKTYDIAEGQVLPDAAATPPARWAAAAAAQPVET